MALSHINGCECDACAMERAAPLRQPWRDLYDLQPWLYETRARAWSVRMVVPVLTMLLQPIHEMPVGFALAHEFEYEPSPRRRHPNRAGRDGR